MSKVYVVVSPKYEYDDEYYNHSGDAVGRVFDKRKKADALAEELNKELVARAQDPDQCFLRYMPEDLQDNPNISVEDAVRSLEECGHGVHRVVEVEVES